VSLKPNITEILFDLNLGDRLVGVTNYCNWPPETQKISKVGGYINPNLEAILVLKPDLVIGEATGSEEVIKQLERLGIPILILSFKTLDELYKTIETLGQRLHRINEAGKLIKKMRGALQPRRNVKTQKEKLKVLVVVGRTPLFAAGPGNFIDEMLTLAGVQNVVHDSLLPFPQFNEEALIARRPDVIIDISMGTEGYHKKGKSALRFWQRFSSLPAVQNERIYFLDPDLLLRPGPRLIEGYQLLLNAIYSSSKPKS